MKNACLGFILVMKSSAACKYYVGLFLDESWKQYFEKIQRKVRHKRNVIALSIKCCDPNVKVEMVSYNNYFARRPFLASVLVKISKWKLYLHKNIGIEFIASCTHPKNLSTLKWGILGKHKVHVANSYVHFTAVSCNFFYKL